MTQIRYAFLSGSLLLLAALEGCQKKELLSPDSISAVEANKPNEAPGFASNAMVLHWNENVMKVLGVTPSPPPIISRHATMVQIAVYDALNAIKPKYQSYALTGVRNKDANPDAAVASAAYWTMVHLDAYLRTFPPGTVGLPLQTATTNWQGWYTASMATIPDGAGKTAGIELGKQAAQAIMNKRSTDNYAQARVVYVPIAPPPMPPAAGTWRPTIANAPLPPYHIGGLPYWGTLMKSFSGLANDAYRPAAPPALTSATYAQDYNEVKALGARVGSTRNAEQSVIANFWQEGASQILNRQFRNALMNKPVDAWRSARLLAMANTAIFDALLTSFNAMGYYHRWRPESAIRLGNEDGNPATEGQADWLPFVTDVKLGPPPQTPTPPIQDYPNTNAAIGWASAAVLQSFFGTDNTNISMTSLDVSTAPGTVRNFTRFSDLTREYSVSRIYAGFGFNYSLLGGEELGKQTGNYILEHTFKEND